MKLIEWLIGLFRPLPAEATSAATPIIQNRPSFNSPRTLLAEIRQQETEYMAAQLQAAALVATPEPVIKQAPTAPTPPPPVKKLRFNKQDRTKKPFRFTSYRTGGEPNLLAHRTNKRKVWVLDPSGTYRIWKIEQCARFKGWNDLVTVLRRGHHSKRSRIRIPSVLLEQARIELPHERPLAA